MKNWKLIICVTFLQMSKQVISDIPKIAIPESYPTLTHTENNTANKKPDSAVFRKYGSRLAPCFINISDRIINWKA